MNLLDTYCNYKFNSIIVSKLVLKQLFDLPKIIKLSFFFFIQIKKYKKNLLLFYIVISLFFGSLIVIKQKEIRKNYIFNIVLKKKKIKFFFISFVCVYLPLINVSENLIKCVIAFSKANKIYRLNYSHFPTIMELDNFFTVYELTYYYVGDYRFQLDFYFYTMPYIKNNLDFLLRMYRLPSFFKYKKKLC
jgi:hypothetical protein